MQEIKDTLKVIQTDVSEIKVNVAVNTVSLTAHMARTEANEVRITYIERMLIGLAAAGVLGGIIKIFTG